MCKQRDSDTCLQCRSVPRQPHIHCCQMHNTVLSNLLLKVCNRIIPQLPSSNCRACQISHFSHCNRMVMRLDRVVLGQYPQLNYSHPTTLHCAGDDEAGTAHAGALTHPQGSRPPGFHQPPGRPPAGQRAPQQQQRQQGNAKPGKLWVLDGRIYNYRYAASTS